MNNQISASDPKHLQQISAAHTNLRETLESASANAFPKTWNPILDELRVYNLLGTRLLEKINIILRTNQITLDRARDEIQALLTPLEGIQQNLQKIMEGLTHFELTGDDLEAGECEVSVLLPRSIFGNDLEGLANEIDALNDLMLVLIEIGTHSRESPKLRQISTSDPFIVFGVPAAAVLFVLKVVNMLLEVYERVVKIRAAGAQAEAAELNKTTIKDIANQAEKAIEKHIAKFVKDLGKNYLKPANWKDKGREKELRTELEPKLKALISRIDHGYRIEAHVKELPAPDEGDEEEGKEKTESRNQIEEIRQLANKMKYFEPEGEPILNLPPPRSNKKEDGGEASE